MPNPNEYNIELTASQQDPGRARAEDFTITSSGDKGHGQSDAALLKEAMKLHPNQTIPVRNTIPAR